MNNFNRTALNKTAVIFLALQSPLSFAAGDSIEIDERSEITEFDRSVFKADPAYPEKNYSYEEQLKIYGGKSENENPRPLLELGHRIYDVGEINPSSTWLGEKNPVNQDFVIYGDYRIAYGFNDIDDDNQQQVAATTLNLELDWRFTGTERIHGKLTPLEERNRFTRVTRFEDESFDEEEFESDFRFDSLFFEGDLGYLVTGATGEYQSWDLPFAFGLMPLLFQNGVWLDDAFTGLAVTLPAENSRALDISNFDITFFAGVDKVTTGIAGLEEDDASVFGVNAFLDANQGYWEVGYGFMDDQSDADVHDYHNLTVAFTRRYFGWLSNSVRVVGNFGQDDDAGETADGVALLLENSFVTSLPSTYVPYANFFMGVGNPQSLARGNGAGGILKNTGLICEGDALTNFQSVNANVNDVFGGAIGVEYLFSLDQQIVVELGATIRKDSDATDTINTGNQYGLGLRYQRPFTKAWLGRFDFIAAIKENDADSDLDQNIISAKFEIKRKF